MEPADKLSEIEQRMKRVEELLARITSQCEALIQGRQQNIQEVLFSQVAYLGDHRALTYLRSGQKIFVDTRSVDVATHLMFGGYWEPHYATAFSRFPKPGHVVLDIGANHGFYALLAASRVAPNGHVYAFEPNPRFHPLIKASISVNGLDGVITLVDKAVADREGEVMLAFDDHWSAGGHLRAGVPNATTALRPGEQTCAVQAVVLDRLFPELRVDVMKMDIEGAEGPALSGMTALIERSPDLKIMMEFCPLMMSAFKQDAGFVVEFLDSRGFMCWTIGDDGSLAPARWQALLAQHDKVQNVIVSRQGVV
jgi:FkbM family methyltransferase